MSKNKIEKLSGLCVITGASSGIGLELARLAAKDGCMLLLASDTDHGEAVDAVKAAGAPSVETVRCDLATRQGVAELMSAIGERPVDVLMANAGHGQGHAFLDQQWEDIAHVIDTNVKGTTSLLHKIGRRMRERDAGRILVTGSVAGHIPGAFQLVYNSTKAYLDDFCVGLANELKETNVVITNLMPGPTDTEFFERAEMEDTKVGRQDKADPAKVAKDGYEALLDGDTQVTSGLMNKVQRIFADILPEDVVAQMHRRLAKHGEG